MFLLNVSKNITGILSIFLSISKTIFFEIDLFVLSGYSLYLELSSRTSPGFHTRDVLEDNALAFYEIRGYALRLWLCLFLQKRLFVPDAYLQ